MKYEVSNMTCNHCKKRIEDTLSESGVSKFEVLLEEKALIVSSNELDDEAIKSLIMSKGYDIK
ncbi:MAG: heavy-metal-associated domain-containing protein [Candidatus Izemoplasmataceae bacterium]|jgi:copper chaperone CopZ|uniref:heavy-metal-associated domain-containing protein n=1 Tax=Liberiplasma polymorphum TaxID=3374570 RepID=UPI00377621D5